MAKLNNVLKSILRLLLCTSLIVSASLIVNYIINLSPEADGFYIGTMLARLIHGENFWTWDDLRKGVQYSWSVSTVLMILNVLYETICSVNAVRKSKSK